MPLFVALPAKRESLLLHLRSERVGSIQEHRRVGFSFKAERADRPPVIDERSYPCLVILEDGETGVGTLIDDRWAVGTLCFEGETDPAVFLYRPHPLTAQVQQQ